MAFGYTQALQDAMDRIEYERMCLIPPEVIWSREELRLAAERVEMARQRAAQEAYDRKAMCMPSIIIPPYFDGPVFNDDYGVAVESMSGEQWTPEQIEQLKQTKAKVAKVPELPVEVYHTQPFNASAAWEAVRALSRGA